MSEQRKIAPSSKSQSSGSKKGKEVSTSDTVALSSPHSNTFVAPTRTRPKLSYESKSGGFQQKGALPIPASDPDHPKRTLALALISIALSLLITTSTLLWLKLTGGIVISFSITLGLWLTYFGLVPRIAAGVDNWFNRNRPYCILHSREDVMYATSGFASLVGFAFTSVWLA